MSVKININDALATFDDHWNPRVLAQLNGQDVRVAKIKGSFDWHHHEHEDELFLVIAGQLELRFRDKIEVLNPGEMVVVPRGVEHQPHAEEECAILLFEPSSTLNTGNVETERTRRKLEMFASDLGDERVDGQEAESP